MGKRHKTYGGFKTHSDHVENNGIKAVRPSWTKNVLIWRLSREAE